MFFNVRGLRSFLVWEASSKDCFGFVSYLKGVLSLYKGSQVIGSVVFLTRWSKISWYIYSCFQLVIWVFKRGFSRFRSKVRG